MVRILTVDDDPDILMVVRFLLESEGHDVTTIDDPRAALQELGRESYDLAILDVMMPGMTGWQVLSEIRRQPRLRGVGVMMLTAMGDDTNRQKAAEDGADDFMRKPFKPAELVARVQQTLRAREARCAAA